MEENIIMPVPPCVVVTTKIWAKEVQEKNYRWISLQELAENINKNKKYLALSHYGNDQKILEIKGLGFQKVQRVTTYSGSFIDASDTIYLRMFEEWYQMRQLSQNHRIMEYSIFQKNVKETIITGIKPIGEKMTFTLHLEDDNSYIANGIIIKGS